MSKSKSVKKVRKLPVSSSVSHETNNRMKDIAKFLGGNRKPASVQRRIYADAIERCVRCNETFSKIANLDFGERPASISCKVDPLEYEFIHKDMRRMMRKKATPSSIIYKILTYYTVTNKKLLESVFPGYDTNRPVSIEDTSKEEEKISSREKSKFINHVSEEVKEAKDENFTDLCNVVYNFLEFVNDTFDKTGIPKSEIEKYIYCSLKRRFQT